jgi:CheY-like chemotaxis protein
MNKTPIQTPSACGELAATPHVKVVIDVATEALAMACPKRSDLKRTVDQCRVLIAEDEAMIALSLSDLLEDEGYKVSIARDGVEALAEVRRLGEELDALVTDLNMPRMSGEDLIGALRVQRPELPVLVVTGSAPPGGLDELRRHGGGREPFALLHKPMDYADLVETLRRVMLAKHPHEVGSGKLPPAPDVVPAPIFAELPGQQD